MIHNQSIVNANPFNGLSAAEAIMRLKSFGTNELPASKKQSLLSILLRIIQEPMLILLLSCGIIYLITGEAKEGFLLFGSALFVVLITLYQEFKSERALEALRDLSSPRALVIRDGIPLRIPSTQIVPGDLIRLAEGDRVPADAVLISSSHLLVDESILTGESYAVAKVELPTFREEKIDSVSPPHRLFSGTLAVGGQGLAITVSTGVKTELGKIGKAIQTATENETTPLQQELGRLVKVFGVLGIIFSLIIAISHALTQGDWPKGILAGLAAAMSLLPEEFPVVMTIFLAMGAWRISRKNVLTRRVSAIEALGSISALCVDKTGTLTENRMRVRELWNETEGALDIVSSPLTMNSSFKKQIEIAQLACDPTPFDPMEKAILLAQEQLNGKTPLQTLQIAQYPLSTKLMAMSCVHKIPERKDLTVAMKGAPETVISLCKLDKIQTQKILQQVHAFASKGLRVLGVAQSHYAEMPLPERQTDFDFQWLGLLALEDPIRPEASSSIKECQEAGIRVIMLTGDYPETAKSIALQLGIPSHVITGDELSEADDLKLREMIRSVSVFARVKPEQKLRIITALQENGERVAMTGDGVNDAPSLRWANIGVAMGGRGTDVAREASKIVLLDDNFSSLVAAIRLGRRIYDNIQKAVFFILAIHVPIAGLAILPVIFKLPLFLMPAHIVFLELIIDPASSLVYEMEEESRSIMKQPPRPLTARLIGLKEFLIVSAQGLVILILVLGLYVNALNAGKTEQVSRTMGFVALVLSNLSLIFVDRSNSGNLFSLFKQKNVAFHWVTLGTIILLSVVLFISPVRDLFSFSSISVKELCFATLIAFFSFITNGLLLFVLRKKQQQK